MLDSKYAREDPDLLPVQRRWLDRMAALARAHPGCVITWDPDGFRRAAPGGGTDGPDGDPARWPAR